MNCERELIDSWNIDYWNHFSNYDNKFNYKLKKRWLKGKKPVYYFADKLEYNLTNSNFSNKSVIKELNMKEAKVYLILVF